MSGAHRGGRLGGGAVTAWPSRRPYLGLRAGLRRTHQRAHHSAAPREAQVAVVVTTSVFTKPAAEYGARHGIRLFDESALAAWATRTGPAPWML
ncbi:restriction endonuclease [Streptomyces sp. NPDC059909]|uniref:restriction endonuclease n=1 Tax=Streptomyces sp. NPDC059909 TaxID=3346998 RepID=UPI00365730DA